jgi:hypothetical protein
MAEWIEVPAHRIYAISERELRDDFDYIGENGRPVARGEIPYRFVRRKDGKFLSGPASTYGSGVVPAAHAERSPAVRDRKSQSRRPHKRTA